MNHQPLRPVRWLVNLTMAVLVAIGLADLLTSIVQRYTPTWFESIAKANWAWPTSWRYEYVHWLYSTYMYEALFIGLLGGFLTYWSVYNRLRYRPSE